MPDEDKKQMKLLSTCPVKPQPQVNTRSPKLTQATSQKLPEHGSQKKLTEVNSPVLPEHYSIKKLSSESPPSPLL
jgi:hypothetical protein